MSIHLVYKTSYQFTERHGGDWFGENQYNWYSYLLVHIKIIGGKMNEENK